MRNTPENAKRLELRKMVELPNTPPEWLIDGLLVPKQPTLIAGPSKALKTSLTLDLAISLAARTRFPGKDGPFGPPTRAYVVAMFSGESGNSTIRAAAERIREAKELAAIPDSLWFSEDVPSLSKSGDVNTLMEEIRKIECEVMILDPMYLCMPGVKMHDLTDVGSTLRGLCDPCVASGCTPILVHHTAKRHSKPKDGPLELTDMAFAGFAEFARQWILIRRKSFYKNDGRHELILSTGGSAGQGRRLSLTVDEGKEADQLRKWETSCTEFQPATLQGKPKKPTRSTLVKQWLLEELQKSSTGQTQPELVRKMSKLYRRERRAALNEQVVRDLLTDLKRDKAIHFDNSTDKYVFTR